MGISEYESLPDVLILKERREIEPAPPPKLLPACRFSVKIGPLNPELIGVPLRDYDKSVPETRTTRVSVRGLHGNKAVVVAHVVECVDMSTIKTLMALSASGQVLYTLEMFDAGGELVNVDSRVATVTDLCLDLDGGAPGPVVWLLELTQVSS